MRMRRAFFQGMAVVCVARCAVGGRAVWADTIELRSGVVRQGIIESQDAKEVRMRVKGDGIEATVVVPMADIARIVKGGPTGEGEKPRTATAPASRRWLLRRKRRRGRRRWTRRRWSGTGRGDFFR